MIQVPARSAYPSVSFVLSDAGETKALQPVMQTLDRMGVPYYVLAEATAKHLLAGNPHVTKLPQDILALSQRSLSEAGQARQQFNQALNASVVVTGLVSQFQQAWATFFKQRGKPVVGYYDAFGFNRAHNKADSFAGCISTLVTPSRDTATFFSRRFPGLPVYALGQPALEAMAQQIKQANPAGLAASLGIQPGKPVLLFAGGYGPGYKEAFTAFCRAVKTLPRLNILVSCHPKSDGQFENELIQKFNLQNMVRVVPKAIDSSQLLPIANLVLSHNSSLTIQGLMLGKQAMLVGDADERQAFNPATYYGVAKRYRTGESLARALQQWIALPGSQQMASPQLQGRCHSLLGIPKAATANITQFLLGMTSPMAWPASRQRSA